jgi:hypothetical protein
MKKHLFTLIIALLASCSNAFSQEFKVKKDTAFVDGKPYCIVKDRSFGREYRILSLKGKELIFGKMETVGLLAYFTLSFLDSGLQCEREAEMGFGKKLARELYERGALTLTADTIDAIGLKKFLMTHTRKFSEEAKSKAAQKEADTQTDAERPNIKLVERNREAALFVSSTLIEQDFKKLGTYTMKDDALPGGIQTTLKIVDMDGNPVAEVIFKGLNEKTGSVFTFADRRKHSFTSDKGHVGFPLAKDFAKFLIDKRYL